jgi:hypothetical protein
MKKSELKKLIKEQIKSLTSESEGLHDFFYGYDENAPKSQGLNKFRKPKGNGLYSLNNKEINPNSIELEDVFSDDHPDFSDAYVSYAEYLDGTPLDRDELEELNDVKGNDIVQDKMFN